MFRTYQKEVKRLLPGVQAGQLLESTLGEVDPRLLGCASGALDTTVDRGG